MPDMLMDIDSLDLLINTERDLLFRLDKGVINECDKMNWYPGSILSRHDEELTQGATNSGIGNIA